MALKYADNVEAYKKDCENIGNRNPNIDLPTEGFCRLDCNNQGLLVISFADCFT